MFFGEAAEFGRCGFIKGRKMSWKNGVFSVSAIVLLKDKGIT